MLLVIIIDLIVVAILFYKSSQKGVENALPAFAFFAVLLPEECQIVIPGVIGLPSQRLGIIVIFVCYLLFRRREEVPQKVSPVPLLALMFIHIVWCLISTANSVVPLTSLKKVFYVVFEYYALYYVFYKEISSTETIQRIVRGMVWAMVLSTIPGAIESYTGWQIISWFPDAGTTFGYGNFDEARGIRTTSTFAHAILYGAALAMAIPLTMYVIANSKSVLKKVLLWAGLLLMFLCLYKTGSRGPWIASMLGFIFVLFMTATRIRKYMVIIVLLCVTVLIVRPGVWETVRDYYDATVNPDNPMYSSYEYRYALRDVVKKAVSRSTERELWGYGMESFYFLHLTGPFLDKEDHKFESCDSAWLETIVETGYVGLVIFVLLLGSAFVRMCAITWRLPKPHRYLQWIFLASLVQYFFLMLSVAIYAWGQNGLMLWMTIAASLKYAQLLPDEARATEDLTEGSGAKIPQGRRLISGSVPVLR
jgi:O-antigen ligase